MSVMLDSATILSLLEKKTELFSEYEKVTDEMLQCAIDEMLSCVGKRQDLAHEIDEIDKELSQFYDGESGELLRLSVLNKLEWEECPTEYKEFYLAGQKLIACFKRIAEKEDKTTSYVEEQKEQLLKLIKEQNTGISAKAAKYYGTVRQSEENFTFFNNKY